MKKSEISTLTSNYYSSEYFNWQKEIGLISADVELFKFRKYITKDDAVLDFGCGGGYILNALDCKLKFGVEINTIAANNAANFGIKIQGSLSELDAEFFDVVISHHALEHCENPYEVIKEVYRVLKPGGMAIFVVPSEHNRGYRKFDINRHLFTWSPNNLGNLFASVGFNILKVWNRKFLWFGGLVHVYRYLGKITFQIFAKIHGLIRPSISEVQIIAIKPKDSFSKR